jgi:Hypervirulence associated proteins TUDOR domain
VGTKAMPKIFKRGDHVEWNSEAGRVRGVIIKKVVSNIRIKGYVHHASKEEPQYLIESDKTDHVAIHKGKALRHIRANAKKKSKKQK